jgi:hypothetical protein
LPVLNAGLLHLWFLKHEPFKAFGVPQGSDMDATLTAEQIVQFLKMLIHLWELHAGIGGQHHIDGHILFDHQQKHGCTVLAS